MTRVLVNIRGTNGAGKTSLIKSFIDETTEHIYLNNKIIATHFKRYNLIAIGEYSFDKKMGGADLLSGQEEYFKIIEYILSNYSENILFEGLLVSTTFNTYFKKFEKYKKEFNLNYIILLLNPPVKTCLDRVHNRTKRGEYYKKNVVEKHKAIYNASLKFHKKGSKLIIINNEKEPINITKTKLLKLITKESLK